MCKNFNPRGNTFVYFLEVEVMDWKVAVLEHFQ